MSPKPISMTNQAAENNENELATKPALPGVAALFQEGWKYAISQPKLVAILSAPFAVLEVINYFGSDAGSLAPNGGVGPLLGLGSFIALIFYVLFLAAALYMIVHQEESPSFAQGLTWAKSNFWRLVWLSILTSLIVWGGFVLLIVPGIIVAVYVCLSQIVLVKESQTGLAALLRSRQLVWGNWWAVALRLLGAQLLYFVLILLIGFVIGGSSAVLGDVRISELVTGVLFTILGAVGTLIFISITLRIYQVLSAQQATKTAVIADSSTKYKFLGWLGLIVPLLLVGLGAVGMYMYTDQFEQGMSAAETLQLEQSLGQVRHEAEKYYTASSPQTYKGVCAELAAFSTDENVQTTCNDDEAAYAISATAGEQTRCVDSTGYNKIIYTALGDRTQCLDI